MLSKVLLLLSGHAAASVILLTRNLAVAWLIPVADYGIATTFAVTIALVEMSTQFGLQQQIVQAKDGENERFQSALQGFQVIRGALAALVLFAMAGPIASFLRIPEVTWAYQVMALLPFLKSLQHFDIHRLNRSLRYLPMLLTSGVPALMSLIAVFPLAYWLGDYRVMLFALVLQEALAAITSHVMAERRYRLVFDRKIIANSLSFGWPLLLNGALLFLVMQGDKVIVGRELGMAALGIFGMGITLTLTPTLILAKSTQNFFLPQLSAAANAAESSSFAPLARTALQASLFNGLFLVLCTFAVGIPFLAVLLGTKFEDLQPLIIWLAAQQGIRVFKSGPSIAAIAKGKTTNALWPNLLRAATLPLAWFVVINGGGLWHVITIALIGEGLGYCLALWLVRARLDVPLRPMIPSLCTAAGIVAAALVVPSIGATDAVLWVNLAIIGVAIALLVVTMADLRGYVRTHLGPNAKRKV